MTEAVHAIEDFDGMQVLSHPLRVRILESLREPGSAATVARAVGEPRQKVNYHLKELERVGLVEPAGERRVGNFVEKMYRSIARSFVVVPALAWADGQRGDALRAQHSLERLVSVGEHLQRDAIALLDRAAFDAEEIPSATVEADVHFADEASREAFLQEYLVQMRELCSRYGAPTGAPYRVVIAVHPDARTEAEATT